MIVKDPLWNRDMLVVFQRPHDPGKPMHIGRVVKQHWHTNHINDREDVPYWSYTIVVQGLQDQHVLERDVLSLAELK